VDNQIFREKIVLIVGTMGMGISAAIYLTALAAASPNMSQSEGLAFGIPLLLANVLALVNIGILCCFPGGARQLVVCRTILGLAIAGIFLVFLMALGSGGS
jgi:hypothetical protein